MEGVKAAIILSRPMPKVQGLCRPRAFRGSWQNLGASLRSLSPSRKSPVAPLQRAPPEQRVRGISPEVGSPRNKTRPTPRPTPRPAPRAPPCAPVSSKTWSCGTAGTAGSALGMLGARQGPSAREEEPPGGVGEASCRIQPDLQPTRFPPPIRVGSGGILLVCFFSKQAQWESWELRNCKKYSLSFLSCCVTWDKQLTFSVP